MALAAALAKHFNIVFSVYRKTANTTGSMSVTYALSSASNEGYMSCSVKENLDNGVYQQKAIYRLRTAPLDVKNDDRVLVTAVRGTALTGYDREIYQVLSAENIDRLNDEQVTVLDKLNEGAIDGLPT